MQVSMTVNEVLQTEGFQHSTILAGTSGLQRQVTKITVAELPDTLDWLQGGELVCSTVYFLKDNPRALEEWIIGMAERNVGALVIKPSRFIGKVSEQMITLANECNFPLIEVPLTVTWPIIIGGVMSRMLEIQTARLSQSLQIHEKLTELVLTSKGIDTIIKTIADLVGNPIILEDKSFNLIAKAQFTSTNRNSEAVKVRLSPEIVNLLKGTPYLRKAANAKEKLLLRDTILIGSSEIQQIIFPVTAGNNLFGWLTALMVNSPEKPFDQVALEHGATVLALELLKEKFSLEALARAKIDFLRGMLEDTHISDHELQKKATILGIDLTLPTIVMIISISSHLSTRSYLQLEEYLNSNDPNCVIVSRTNDAVVFYHPQHPELKDKSKEVAQKIAGELSSILTRNENQHNIGIGRCYHGIREVSKSYYEAKQAVRAASQTKKSIQSFHGLGLDRFISLIVDEDGLTSFCEDNLAKLVDYDTKHKSALLKTLSYFLRLNCSYVECAKELHLHINSLNYRIQRIQQIMGIDINDAETRLFLYLNIKILEFTEPNK